MSLIKFKYNENLSTSMDKIAKKQGEWLEKYVEKLFQLAGFDTKRNLRKKKIGIEHEIDILASKGGNEILVECKDRKRLTKGEMDAFVGKLTDLEAELGVFVTTNIGDFDNYKKYLKNHNIIFLDGEELEELWKKYLEIEDKEKFRKHLNKKFKVKKKGFLQKLRNLF